MDRSVTAAGAWRAVLVASLLVAFGLGAYRLGAQSLWSDEDITLDRAEAPVATILAELPPEHTPLYFVALRGWTRLAGTSDVASANRPVSARRTGNSGTGAAGAGARCSR